MVEATFFVPAGLGKATLSYAALFTRVFSTLRNIGITPYLSCLWPTYSLASPLIHRLLDRRLNRATIGLWGLIM